MPSIKNNLKGYHHFQKTERLELAILLEKGYSLREISGTLKRSVGALCDEINRHLVEDKYDPIIADERAILWRKNSKYQAMKIVEDSDLRDYVELKIKEDWSPDEIAGRLREVDHHLTYASHQIIYKFVHSPYADKDLKKHLRHSRKQGKEYIKVPQLKDRVFIDQRPSIIEKKQRFFDWEGDFIVSGKNGQESLLVLYERKSQLGLIQRIKTRKAEEVNQIFQKITGKRVFFNSLTLDNDMVFSKHKLLSKIVGADIYFCHPYHFWEKGGVENFNKLIRQYIPKGSDISKYSDDFIKEVENKLNNRPRKQLNYKTPLEVLKENNQRQTINSFESIRYFANILDKQKTAGCSA